jgi:hypothetical protein
VGSRHIRVFVSAVHGILQFTFATITTGGSLHRVSLLFHSDSKIDIVIYRNVSGYYIGYDHVQWINDNCEFWGVFCCPSSWVQVNGGIRWDSDNYSIWLLEDSC